jgi:hypothetical protein
LLKEKLPETPYLCHNRPYIKIFTLEGALLFMKNRILSLLCLFTVCTSSQVRAEEDINILAQETDELYRPGTGSQDGAYTALSLSMLGWGLGIAAGVGILASLLHQSTSSSGHDSCSHN